MTQSDIQAVILSSRQHLSAGAPDLAIQQLREVLDTEPNHLASLKLLGIACAMNGDTRAAILSLEAAVAQEDTDAQTRYNLALLYEKQSRFTEALVSVEAALRMKPDYALALQARERVQPRAQEILDQEAQEAEELAFREAQEARAQARREAAERMAHLPVGDPEPLIEAALHHEEPQVRRCAVRVFSQVPRSRALEFFSAALEDEDDLVRRSAVKSLSRDSSEDVVPLLRRALADPQFSVRSTAVQALIRLSDSEALLRLRQMLEADGMTPEEAAKLLIECDDPGLADRIEEWSSHPHAGVRETAAAVLEGCRQSLLGRDHGDTEAHTDALIERLKTATLVGERDKAARALGHIGGPTAAAALKEALKDRAFSVRIESARSLAAIGDPYAIDVLLPMLSDSYLGARPVAVEALSALGWRPALLTDWVATTFADLNEGERRALLKEFAVIAVENQVAEH